MENFGGLFGVRRHRLLQQHVLARFQGRHGHRRMQMIGQRDGDGVDVGLLEQFAEISVTAGDFETFAGFAGAERMIFRDCHRGRARAGG